MQNSDISHVTNLSIFKLDYLSISTKIIILKQSHMKNTTS